MRPSVEITWLVRRGWLSSLFINAWSLWFLPVRPCLQMCSPDAVPVMSDSLIPPTLFFNHILSCPHSFLPMLFYAHQCRGWWTWFGYPSSSTRKMSGSFEACREGITCSCHPRVWLLWNSPTESCTSYRQVVYSTCVLEAMHACMSWSPNGHYDKHVCECTRADF